MTEKTVDDLAFDLEFIFRHVIRIEEKTWEFDEDAYESAVSHLNSILDNTNYQQLSPEGKAAEFLTGVEKQSGPFLAGTHSGKQIDGIEENFKKNEDLDTLIKLAGLPVPEYGKNMGGFIKRLISDLEDYIIDAKRVAFVEFESKKLLTDKSSENQKIEKVINDWVHDKNEELRKTKGRIDEIVTFLEKGNKILEDEDDS